MVLLSIYFLWFLCAAEHVMRGINMIWLAFIVGFCVGLAFAILVIGLYRVAEVE